MPNSFKCPKCGAEYKKDDKYCSSCGAELGVPKVKSKGEKHTHQINQSPKGKLLNFNYVIQFLIVLFVLTALNLYFAGVFEEPDASTVQTSVNSQDPHKGVDMSKLETIKNLESKIQNNPEDADSIRELIGLLRESGFTQRAIESYEKYLDLRVDDYTTLMEYSHYLHDNQQWAKAISSYDKYLKKFPASPDILVDQGVCYFSLSDYDNAKRVMRKALAYDNKHVFAHFNLGIVNLNAGDKKAGIEWLNKVINLDPNAEMAKKAQEIIDSNN